ncbi:MAG: hypothetical protein ACRENO_03315 [Thermodesulfobacteriota bacterium]
MILFVVPASIWAQNQDENFPFSYTQSAVRSPEGTLIVYQENYSPRLQDPELFNEFLNAEIRSGDASLTVLAAGNSTFEMIQFETNEKFTFEQLRAWDNLLGVRNEETVGLAIFFHEGYPVLSGEELIINWVFIRPQL